MSCHISNISPEAQRRHPDEGFNTSWQSTVAITTGLKQWQASNSAAHKCMTAARHNMFFFLYLLYKWWRLSEELYLLEHLCNTVQSSTVPLQYSTTTEMLVVLMEKVLIYYAYWLDMNMLHIARCFFPPLCFHRAVAPLPNRQQASELRREHKHGVQTRQKGSNKEWYW